MLSVAGQDLQRLRQNYMSVELESLCQKAMLAHTNADPKDAAYATHLGAMEQALLKCRSAAEQFLASKTATLTRGDARDMLCKFRRKRGELEARVKLCGASAAPDAPSASTAFA